MKTQPEAVIDTLGDIDDVANFLRDLQEEQFPKCKQWDIDPRDCNCIHCRINHYVNQAEAMGNAARLEIMQKQRRINAGEVIISNQKHLIESLSKQVDEKHKELEALRAIDRERVRLLDETASLRSARHPA